MAKTSYFGVDGLFKKPPRGRGLTVTRKTLKTQFDLAVPKSTALRGYLIQGSERALEKWREPRRFIEPRDFMLLPDGSDCKLLVSGLTEAAGLLIEDKTGFLKEVPEAEEELKRVLRPLCGATNRLIRVTFMNELQTPPLVKEQHQGSLIDIIVGPSPLGVSEEQRSTTLCGVKLDQRGYYLHHCGPAMGRGIILKDDEGNTFAQVVNGVIYLLLPVRLKQAFQLLDSKSGAGLFKKAFVPAWNALIAPSAEQRTKRRVLWNDEEIAVYSAATIKAQTASTEVLLAVKRTTVDTAYRAYQEALRDLESVRVYSEAVRSRTERDIRQVTEDWKRLLTHPQVATVYAENEAIYVETRVLHVEHAGKRYRIGAFVIRLSFVDDVGIWCKKRSEHKRGITHPHISGEGAICFGNVTRSINEDLVACRIGSAAETILRWLTDGYDHVRASTKIEEWPLSRRKPA